MARIDNPFSLFEADDDELDPVAILARAQAKKISEVNSATIQGQLPEPQKQLEKKDDTGGRAERGRGGVRGGRGRGVGRSRGDSSGHYGDGFSGVYGGEHEGRGERIGRGGAGRGRVRGFYEYRVAGNRNGVPYGANRNQTQDRGVAEGEVSEGQEVQGSGYYGNRRGRNENHSSGWDASGYGGEGRRSGGHGGRYDRSDNWNELPITEGAGDVKTHNEEIGIGVVLARDVPVTSQVTKYLENEVPKSADEATAKDEVAAPVDASEKKDAEDDTMTLEEYEKLLFEKRKAIEALKPERKVDIDVEKIFGGMTLIEKKKEEDIFVKLKSEKDKLKKVTLEKEDKPRKVVSINEFLKPAEGETYRGPSYARERAARIRSERRAREEEEQKHASAGDGVDVPAAPPSSVRSRGRGSGPRGGYRGGFAATGERGGRSRSESGGNDAAIPENVPDEEFLDREFPALGGAIKA